MKKIFKSLIFISVMSLFVISCSEDETTFNALDFPSDSFIALEDTSSINVLESTTTPIEIVVVYANTTEGHTSAQSADFTITSPIGVEGVHYTVDKAQLSFPAGVFSDKIVITAIDNAMEDGDKVLTFTLTSSSIPLGFPGPDAGNTSMQITLTDDDCSFTFADLDGVAWSGSDNVPGSQAGPNPTQITTSFDGTNLLMDGLSFGWLTDTDFWDEVVIDSDPVIVDMNPITGEFTIAEQFLAVTTWNGNVQPTYSISATGQYFSCLQLMIVNYTLYQGGGILREFTETIEF